MHAKTPSTSSPGAQRGDRGLGGWRVHRHGGRRGLRTVNRMQPLVWERRPDGLRAPALVCAFKGWNDAGEAASAALHVRRRRARRHALRADRSRGVLRLPGDAPDASGSSTAVTRDDRLARGRDLRGAGPARAARPDPAHRPRAVDALAHVLRRRSSTSPRRSASQMVVTLGALLADVPHSRPVVDHRHRLRRGARRAARPAAARTYEGPTGSSACCTPRAPEAGMPSARCGPPCRTTSPPRRTRRPRSRCVRQLEGARRRHRRRGRARGRRRRLRAPGHAAPSQSDPDVQAFVERLERAADEDETSRSTRATLPSGDVHRPRVPALPAPARPRRGVAHAGTAETRRASTARPPGRRSGSRTSSSRRTTASARSPGRGCPSATSITVSGSSRGRSSARSTGTFSSSST